MPFRFHVGPVFALDGHSRRSVLGSSHPASARSLRKPPSMSCLTCDTASVRRDSAVNGRKRPSRASFNWTAQKNTGPPTGQPIGTAVSRRIGAASQDETRSYETSSISPQAQESANPDNSYRHERVAAFNGRVIDGSVRPEMLAGEARSSRAFRGRFRSRILRFVRIALLLDRAVDLFAMNAHMFGSFDAQADFVPLNGYHHERDGIANNDLFVLFSAEYEHCVQVLCRRFGGRRPSSIGRTHTQP